MYWEEQTENSSHLLVELYGYWAAGLAERDAAASCRGRPNQTGHCEGAARLQQCMPVKGGDWLRFKWAHP